MFSSSSWGINQLIEAEWRIYIYIYIYASINLLIIDSDNGLSPGRRQAIIWTNSGILLSLTLGTEFSEILIKIHIFPFKDKYFWKGRAKCRPFYLGLSVLRYLLTNMVITRLINTDTLPGQNQCQCITRSKRHWSVRLLRTSTHYFSMRVSWKKKNTVP